MTPTHKYWIALAVSVGLGAARLASHTTSRFAVGGLVGTVVFCSFAKPQRCAAASGYESSAQTGKADT